MAHGTHIEMFESANREPYSFHATRNPRALNALHNHFRWIAGISEVRLLALVSVCKVFHLLGNTNILQG
jgi:hypothetical protein